MPPASAIRKIAFLGDYLPRKCGIATFTTDLRCAVATEFPKSERWAEARTPSLCYASLDKRFAALTWTKLTKFRA